MNVRKWRRKAVESWRGCKMIIVPFLVFILWHPFFPLYSWGSIHFLSLSPSSSLLSLHPASGARVKCLFLSRCPSFSWKLQPSSILCSLNTFHACKYFPGPLFFLRFISVSPVFPRIRNHSCSFFSDPPNNDRRPKSAKRKREDERREMFYNQKQVSKKWSEKFVWTTKQRRMRGREEPVPSSWFCSHRELFSVHGNVCFFRKRSVKGLKARRHLSPMDWRTFDWREERVDEERDEMERFVETLETGLNKITFLLLKMITPLEHIQRNISCICLKRVEGKEELFILFFFSLSTFSISYFFQKEDEMKRTAHVQFFWIERKEWRMQQKNVQFWIQMTLLLGYSLK